MRALALSSVVLVLMALVSGCGGGASGNSESHNGGGGANGEGLSRTLPRIVVMPDVNNAFEPFSEDERSIHTQAAMETDNGLCLIMSDAENVKRPYVIKDGALVLLADVEVVGEKHFTALGGKLFFSAYEPVHGIESWVTDGTVEGTYIFADIRPGSFHSYPTGMIVFNEKLYINANGSTYVSDGNMGTISVVSDNVSGNGLLATQGLTVSGGLMFFFANDRFHGLSLFATDGTDAGTRLVYDHVPGYNSIGLRPLAPLGGKIYFPHDDGNGTFLWASDGTEEGTLKVAFLGESINPEYVRLTCFGQRLLIYVPDGGGDGLWISDGTELGTNKLMALTGGFCNPSAFHVFNDKVFFNVGGELWSTDGTSEGTSPLSGVKLFSGNSSEPIMAEYNGLLYFQGGDDSGGEELWVTDGTVAGTRLFMDVNFGVASSYPREFVAHNGHLYFHADDGEYSDALYRTDGTPLGTVRIFGVTPFISPARMEGETPEPPSDDVSYVKFGDKLLFSKRILTIEPILHVTDGTPEGTFCLGKPGFPETPLVYMKEPHAILGGKLYYFASGGLWATDGTPAGTRLALPGVYSKSIDQIGDYLFFMYHTFKYGSEPWISDGTPWGTGIISNINLSNDGNYTSSNSFGQFVGYNGVVYFATDDNVNGWELWETDLTQAGTKMTANINTNVDWSGNGESSNPNDFSVIDGLLYFVANETLPPPSESQFILPDLWVFDGVNPPAKSQEWEKYLDSRKDVGGTCYWELVAWYSNQP